MRTGEKQAILTDLGQTNLFLIGFMGCGKTETGKALHRLTGLPLLDMDHVIEQEQGCSIPTLFKKQGEAAFRRLESDLLGRLCDAQRRCKARKPSDAYGPSNVRSVNNLPGVGFSPSIVACGGGVVELPENVSRLRATGRAFFLHGGLELLFSRIKDDENRPNARADISDEEAQLLHLRTLCQKRESSYRNACSHMISIEEKTPEEIAWEILEFLH